MSRVTPPNHSEEQSIVPRIAAAALAVAVLDLSFAITCWVLIRHATTVIRLLQSIATGVLGRDSFQGGPVAAAIGLVVHCTVATGWTLIYFMLVRRWSWLRRVASVPGYRPFLGIGYGMTVWLLMDFAILPLSRSTPTLFPSVGFFVTLLAHVTVVGPPIVLIVRDGVTRANMREPASSVLTSRHRPEQLGRAQTTDL